MDFFIFKSFAAELGEISKLASEFAREPQPWTQEDIETMKAERKKNAPPSALNIALQGALGIGAGTLAGGLAGKGIEYLAGRTGHSVGQHLPQIGATAGAITGVAHQLWRARELEALKRAREYSEQTSASISGQ